MSAKPFPLSMIDTLVDKQPIACITGTLIQVWPPKTGENSIGKWHIQNAVIIQDGVKIDVQFKEFSMVLTKEWCNREVIIEAQNAKSLTGLYVWDDDRSTPAKRKIKVTATATISLVEEAAQQRPAQQPTQRLTQPADDGPPADYQDPGEPVNLQQPEKTHTAQQSEPKPRQQAKEKDDFHEARKTINQIANLHLLCQLAVERYEAPTFANLTGTNMTESQRQGATASIFIESCKNGLVRSMPVVDATKDERFSAEKS